MRGLYAVIPLGRLLRFKPAGYCAADGYIRHELLPGGRYDEARGNRKSAYRGSYWIKGDHIEYVDDTGFTADGDFRNDVLYQAGMILYREVRK